MLNLFIAILLGNFGEARKDIIESDENQDINDVELIKSKNENIPESTLKPIESKISLFGLDHLC